MRRASRSLEVPVEVRWQSVEIRASLESICLDSGVTCQGSSQFVQID